MSGPPLNEWCPEADEPSERVVPFALFSHVSGGPETCTGAGLLRPIVLACRTVPKSQRSSGSPDALFHDMSEHDQGQEYCKAHSSSG